MRSWRSPGLTAVCGYRQRRQESHHAHVTTKRKGGTTIYIFSEWNRTVIALAPLTYVTWDGGDSIWEPPMGQAQNHFAQPRSSLKTTSCNGRCCASCWKRAATRSSSASAEAAERVLEKSAGALCLMLTDVQLAGPHERGSNWRMSPRTCNPKLDVVVTSGRPWRRPCLTAQNSGPSRGRRSTCCARPSSRSWRDGLRGA